MIRMTLCPNCRTIQKVGTNCTICKCPVRDHRPKAASRQKEAPRK